jgi:hypothetical protein
MVVALSLIIAVLPPASDPLAYAEHAFPSKQTCRRLLEFNCRYQQYLRARRDLLPARYWHYVAVLAETQRRYEIWDALEDVQTPWLSRDRRLERLATFRNLIGESAYRLGHVPCHVPIECFEPVDP